MIKTNIRTLFLLSMMSAAVISLAAQTPTPTVTPSPSPLVIPLPVQTLADLQMKFRQSLAKPEVRRGMVGIKVVSLASGKVVFEENAEKYFMPASNMKNFTVATAIEKLTPDFKFVTSIYSASPPNADGTIAGDLRIFGRGDVSMATRFNGGDPLKSLDPLVDKIVQVGIKRIEGSIMADDSYFRGFAIPVTWEWDDLQWWHGTEISSLPLNESVVVVSVNPGPVGYACSVKMTPYNPVMRITNSCITSSAGSPKTLRVHKHLDQNILEITGTLPVGGSFSEQIAVSRPAELLVAMLRQRLIEKGVVVTGNYRYERRSDASMPPGVEIAKIESAPLSIVAANTMKPSQNMFTETLLWTLGEYARARTANPTVNGLSGAGKDSSELGLSEIKSFLTSIGIAPDGIVQYDGSGLSRHNLITPAAVVQLYAYMAKQSRYSQIWRDSLTIGGVDGTLRNRFRGTRAAANLRGKTGTIDQVSALSGYVKTATGEELAFSMIVNGVVNNPTRVSLLDEMVLHLANFTGRIDQ